MPTTTGKATEFINFSRASNATVVDNNGKIKWAPHNLLLASEQFDSASWTKTNATIAANSIAAPNGTSTADKLAEDAATAAHRVQQGFNATIGATYTISVFAKAAERNWLQFLTNSFSGGNQAANFNLSNGTIGTGASGANLTKTITPFLNGWYVCTVTWTPDATGSNVYFYVMDSDAATGATYAGTAGNGLYIWGAHLYRSDLGGMQANTSAYPMYNPTTPKNLLGYTEDFSNAAWGKTGLTVTANTSTAPNGLVTADTLNDGSATSNHYMAQTISTVAGSTYTASVYAANVDGTYLILDAANLGGASNFASAVFNLSTGAVATSAATGTGYSVVSTSIAAVGGGIYRCSLTFVAGTTAPTSFCIAMTNAASLGAYGLLSYTGSNKSIIVWGAQLSDSASLDTYTRNNFAAPSAAAYYGPRLDFDPVTLACRGLLVEEQRSNILLNSAALSTQSVTVAATAYTLSFWGTGTITLSGTSTAGPLLGTGANNRVTLTFTPTAGTLTLTVSGTVTQAQLETGSFATSYIPTTSASVTRSADVAQVGTSAFPYSATEGTLVFSGSSIQSSGNPMLAVFLESTAGNNYFALRNISGTGWLQSVTAGVFQANFSVASITNATNMKWAAAYKADDFASVINGGNVRTDTSGTVPSNVQSLGIGSFSSNTAVINGYIRQITYIPRRLTNAELQARTA